MSADSADLLRLGDVSVAYGRHLALRGIDLTVREHEIVALLGPSGSGKSTLLHAVAGFLPVLSGEIWLADRRVASARSQVPPEARDLAMVFQNYALWPHLSVRDTVAYPLRRKGTPRRSAGEEAQRLLDLLQVGHLGGRVPASLSGGEQQRVGLARALAKHPSLYLFDEPTAHLDTHLRAVFLDELLARQRAVHASGLYATHDAAEALALADRVALLDRGRIVQVATPEEVYDRPVSLWAARVTGPATLLSGRVLESAGSGFTIDIAGVIVEVTNGSDRLEPGRNRATDILVRTNWVSLGGPLTGRIAAVRYRGPRTDLVVDSAAGQVVISEAGRSKRRVGDTVQWTLHHGHPIAPDADEG